MGGEKKIEGRQTDTVVTNKLSERQILNEEWEEVEKRGGRDETDQRFNENDRKEYPIKRMRIFSSFE
uniref:Uncharacterized protein n=1 Tax=Globodera rostochiensis TaxID=31243 RepID=A0A914HYH2_GLORO